MRDETIRVIFGVLMVYVILVPAFTVTLYCIDEQNRQGMNNVLYQMVHYGNDRPDHTIADHILLACIMTTMLVGSAGLVCAKNRTTDENSETNTCEEITHEEQIH